MKQIFDTFALFIPYTFVFVAVGMIVDRIYKAFTGRGIK